LMYNLCWVGRHRYLLIDNLCWDTDYLIGAHVFQLILARLFWFDDCQDPCPFSNPISLGNLDFQQPDGILMPRLSYFIEVVLSCYKRLDTTFESDVSSFRRICDEYDGESLLE
jgi:hypothetical protein